MDANCGRRCPDGPRMRLAHSQVCLGYREACKVTRSNGLRSSPHQITKRQTPEPREWIGSVSAAWLVASSHPMPRFGSTVVMPATGSSAVLACYRASPPSRVIESQEGSKADILQTTRWPIVEVEVTPGARVTARSYRQGRRDRSGCRPRACSREGDGRSRRDG